MNDIVSPAFLTRRDPELLERADGTAEFHISPEFNCRYDSEAAVLWTTMSSHSIPCFTQALLRDMEHASALIEGHFQGHAESRPLRYIIFRSAVPGVFSLGGDLGYFQRLIADQDRTRLIEYARTAVNVSYRNYTAHNLKGVTTVALLEGDALGGGFESALSCDIVVAERHVKCGFPEVLFDMFPGMGALSFLSRRVNRQVVNELTRTGRQFTAQELFEMGVIDQVVDTGEGPEALERMMRLRDHQHGAHSAMNLADRMLRPITSGEMNDVVRLWVDCAMQLSPRGLQWMRRLHQQQLSAFGAELSMVSSGARMAA